MKPVLMIHEVDEQLFNLPLEDYVLTFDDGLYTQYKYFNLLKEINTRKIFFITTGIICTGVQSTEYITCEQAHEKAFAGNTENYMTIDQIKELASDPLTSIGGHSHNHQDLTEHSLLDKVNFLKKDTEQMIDWFSTNLGHIPNRFCFPYNKNYDGMYNAVLKSFKINDFYGRERISPQHIKVQAVF